MLAYLHSEAVEGLRKVLKLSPAAISPLHSLTKIASPLPINHASWKCSAPDLSHLLLSHNLSLRAVSTSKQSWPISRLRIAQQNSSSSRSLQCDEAIFDTQSLFCVFCSKIFNNERFDIFLFFFFSNRKG